MAQAKKSSPAKAQPKKKAAPSGGKKHMATTDKPSSGSHPTSTAARAPEPGPAPSQAAKPASAEEKKPEEKVVSKEEVRSLFESGHRLKKKGDPDTKWIAATRLHNQLCLAQPVDEELEKTVLAQELVLVTD